MVYWSTTNNHKPTISAGLQPWKNDLKVDDNNFQTDITTTVIFPIKLFSPQFNIVNMTLKSLALALCSMTSEKKKKNCHSNYSEKCLIN